MDKKRIGIDTVLAIIIIIAFIFLPKIPSCDEIKYRRENSSAYNLIQSMKNEFDSRDFYSCDHCGKDAFLSLNLSTDYGEILCLDCASEFLSHVHLYEEGLFLLDHSDHDYVGEPICRCNFCNEFRPSGEFVYIDSVDEYMCTHCMNSSEEIQVVLPE